MKSGRRVVGRVNVDSGQIFIVEPMRLTEVQYDSVVRALDEADGAVEVWIENELGEVTIENFLDPPIRTNDGVAIRTNRDGSFPVWVEYDEEGLPTSIGIDLR